MQAAFSAVLSTVSFETQQQLLHDRLDALMDAHSWEPWFTKWMEKYLARGVKVRFLPGIDTINDRPVSEYQV